MISVLPQKRGAQSIHILNVYCPPHLQRVTFAELFYRALQAAARQPLVVVGDFSAPSPHWGYHYEKARAASLRSLSLLWVYAAHRPSASHTPGKFSDTRYLPGPLAHTQH
ncbi:hypothetical protein HPB49_010283 [Dermacentor silvarum]|uniref:Uncharacterized protein n=1 Tax=Dermacentor silvarum TaxID=543639 RepID=A0ACB8D4G7_DERSI|nr:hypothetical protein HPB49_010283 [Dermacentor silvarum]